MLSEDPAIPKCKWLFAKYVDETNYDYYYYNEYAGDPAFDYYDHIPSPENRTANDTSGGTYSTFVAMKN